ncbi:protein kinase [Aspergillus taichungensis]|uniref:non-specific serine/threonine protein kinase n=1 Tax=Aspergillus taichungensis TaxID=482145 RepID=A0A2J5I5S5_9EURO|nr:protein kinase [Aspergillus taichungensis]
MPVQLPLASTSPVLQHELVDEELCPAYDSKCFHPAKPGEILGNCYQLLVKIGWGTHSTVWLARDMTRHVWGPCFTPRCSKLRWQSERLVTLEIANVHSSKDARHECGIDKHIARQAPSHRGRGIIRTFFESFDVAGPEGSHPCLGYEPMREPLWILQKRFVDQRLPLSIAKAYIFILLAGLDFFAHGMQDYLKPENILVTFENDKILPNFIKEQTTKLPMQYKNDSITGRTIYRCHNDFGPLNWRDLKKMLPKIADFGLATRLDGDNLEVQRGKRGIGLHPIQPDRYRAPEVILGCGWSFSADIWNFGILGCDIIERTGLFRQVYDAEGRYDAKAHLAEMIALLGPPPKEMLSQSKSMIQNLDAVIPSLEEEERQGFLSFISLMLTWRPEDRKTARELMEHPFLNFRRR